MDEQQSFFEGYKPPEPERPKPLKVKQKENICKHCKHCKHYDKRHCKSGGFHKCNYRWNDHRVKDTYVRGITIACAKFEGEDEKK